MQHDPHDLSLDVFVLHVIAVEVYLRKDAYEEVGVGFLRYAISILYFCRTCG